MVKYYKWTDIKGQSCHGGTHNWVRHKTLTLRGGTIEACVRGVHVATVRQAIENTWVTTRCAEVVKSVELKPMRTKAVARSITIGRWCLTPRIARLWMVDCVEHVLVHYEKIDPSFNLRPVLAEIRRITCGVSEECDLVLLSRIQAERLRVSRYYQVNPSRPVSHTEGLVHLLEGAQGAIEGNPRTTTYFGRRAAGRLKPYPWDRNELVKRETSWQIRRLQRYLNGWLPKPARPYRKHLEKFDAR